MNLASNISVGVRDSSRNFFSVKATSRIDKCNTRKDDLHDFDTDNQCQSKILKIS